MKSDKRLLDNFSAPPPLVAGGRAHSNNRQFSKTWLIGSCLIGSTASILMLIALDAAFDGRVQLATPPELMHLFENANDTKNIQDGKGNRISPTLPKQTFVDRQFYQSTRQEQIGERTIPYTQYYEKLHIMLAEERSKTYKYPKLNILDLFSDGETATPKAEVSPTKDNSDNTKTSAKNDLSLVPFFPENETFPSQKNIDEEQAQKDIQQNILNLVSGGTVYSLIPLHEDKTEKEIKNHITEVKIIQENVSQAEKTADDDQYINYSEDILPLAKETDIEELFRNNNYNGTDAQGIAKAFDELYPLEQRTADAIIRLGIETCQGDSHIVRASIYVGTEHILTVACNEEGKYEAVKPPEMTDVLKAALEKGVPVRRISRNLPKIYDAVYRSILSYGESPEMAHQVLRILATDIDLESHISPEASLDIFFPIKNPKSHISHPESHGTSAKDDKTILYVSAKFGSIEKKYYRFQSEDGTIGYYDAAGRNSKQFLLRKPVPNGIFRSPFGSRRHPILGYVRMHTGVDWAAPRGSPIIAVGDGVVTKVGMSRGYGNHTEIQHANGYMTSYSHQSGFAPGIKPGVHVKQGQIIGYVGSTGLSTGPHCHFEIVVNGTKMDPMRVRIPQSKELKSKELENFKQERNKIDTILAMQTTK